MTGFPEVMPIPEEVLDIARRLEAAGFETWCVGGAVRDFLLGEPGSDVDLATAAAPADVLRLFRRTVPIGIDHGTIAVLDRQGGMHEVTTFRRDVQTDGRHAVVAFGADIGEDLARRDFTINAIAYHPLRHRWLDPFHGADDLERGIVRAVGGPADRFREDYLRIVRALRFAARLGFTVDAATWTAARAEVDGITGLSAERVRDEWFKGLRTAKRASELARLWREVGALRFWLPELASACAPGAVQLLALDRFPGNDPVLLTSYLSDAPAATLERLKCSRAEIARARAIGEARPLPHSMSDAAVRRWLSDVGPGADDLVAIAVAEGAGVGAGAGAALANAVGRIRAAGDAIVVGDLAVDGHDALRAGIAPGPSVGRALGTLLNEVLDDPGRNTRDHQLRRLRDLASSGQS